ncbi:STAS domain-containing protein [Microbispora triticiradicis]|uniref:STAS domain-containing protein n=1 Tax=Microbispora triticiradicis TaxID=2200763 RepID=UPI001AD74AB4|nr:STAS domain-containing protein [Microbispora triticiradicis]MBO4269589.1 anti-sigma factor antagonist [Microbispora triticiradicis]
MAGLWSARTILTLDGELDILSSVRLTDAVDAALYGGRQHLLVDAARLTFCDSSGLWALLNAKRTVTAMGGSLELVNVHGILQRVLDITGATRAFPAASGS